MKNKIIDIDAEFDGFELDERSIQKYTTGQKASDTMRGKTLEQILGSKERAEEGRKKRAEAASNPRPKKVVAKILKTKQEKGTYEDPNHGMRNKKHKESTKLKQGTKAQIRQDLKKQLGLGRNDKVPQELLLKAYKKAGLD